MDKTSLIQLGKYYPPVQGGMETHLSDQCAWLRDTFSIEVLVANSCYRTVKEKIDGIKVTRVANLGELFSSPICPSLPYHLKKANGQADCLIEIHMPNPMAHLSYLLSGARGRLVLMWHSDIIKQKRLSKFYDAHLFRLLQRADRVIATSPEYIDHSPFLSRFRQKCVVVPLGVDVRKFRRTTEISEKVKAIKAFHDRKIVLFVGRLTYYKGLLNLLSAAQHIDAHVIIVGNGPMKQILRREIDDNGLHGRVFMYHDVNDLDLVAYYHASDVFVLPSNARSEAFGVVQLEAMACSKPVISTKLTTGVPWVNQHEVTGLVIPPDAP